MRSYHLGNSEKRQSQIDNSLLEYPPEQIFPGAERTAKKGSISKIDKFPNSSVIGHFQLIEKIGGGGMGAVYKAKDLHLNRYVALKFLPPHLSLNKAMKKRFIHEAHILSAIDHPNICAIYEIHNRQKGKIFFVMPYYGDNVLRKIIKKGDLSIDEIVDILIQLVKGLTFIHRKDMIHCDLKPENVLITTEGMVKIIDFGIAKLNGYTHCCKNELTSGTIGYMSPEQICGEDVDHRTDIWSLGVVLYEMLTGQLPFKGKYVQEILYSIVNDQPEPVSKYRNGVPTDLENIVNKCLSKNRAERYSNMAELYEDLSLINNQKVNGVLDLTG